MITQEIRYTTTADGVRIAWASSGEGPPIVKAANWLNHLEFDWESPVWRHVVRELSTDFRLIRYDQRGNGLSDLEVDEFSLEAFVSDLEAVVEAAALDTFTLLGISQGCMHSIAYAARHPERIERLVFHGGYAAGHEFWDDEQRERRAALGTLMKQGWGEDNPAFRQVFSAMFFPDGDAATHAAWNELQRVTPAANALAISAANGGSDVRDLLPGIDIPALVLHSQGELAVPFDRSREIAAALPDARLVSLNSRNHLILEDEPSWPRWLREVRSFLDADVDRPAPPPGAAAPGHGIGGDGDAAALRPGDMLRNYRIEEHIATGGMGAVYRAHDTDLLRDVAVKVLPPGVTENADRLARFRREARLLAALDHPNIAAVYGLETRSSPSFIVMELARGSTLQERLLDGPLGIDESLSLGRDVAAGLEAAHGKGIVHRDLKPSNVMLTASGAKLLDFGIAKLVPAEGVATGAGTLAADELTESGVLLGTGPYMSPEQVRGGDVGAAADVWAFGCVLYEALCGRGPFGRDTLADTLTAVLEHDPDLGALPDATPRSIAALVDECLSKDAGARPADIARVRVIVEEAMRAPASGGILRWFKKGS